MGAIAENTGRVTWIRTIAKVEVWGALTFGKNWSAGGGGRPRSAGAKNGSGEVRVT